MWYYTRARPVVLMGLLQVSGIVYVVLFTAAMMRVMREMVGGQKLPMILEWVDGFGGVLLLVPFLWVLVTGWVSARDPDGRGQWICFSVGGVLCGGVVWLGFSLTLLVSRLMGPG
ncbi:MAG: hypothetical protein ACI8T1_001965 [Verrucomicrobiales bacterium]|jgi:hypothetical protein